MWNTFRSLSVIRQNVTFWPPYPIKRIFKSLKFEFFCLNSKPFSWFLMTKGIHWHDSTNWNVVPWICNHAYYFHYHKMTFRKFWGHDMRNSVAIILTQHLKSTDPSTLICKQNCRFKFHWLAGHILPFLLSFFSMTDVTWVNVAEDTNKYNNLYSTPISTSLFFHDF